MTKYTYQAIKAYMEKMMKDSAHDKLHVIRVLNQALVIAENYPEVDLDILIASALLHDIGRDEEMKYHQKSHADIGAEYAYEFLKSLSWEDNKCQAVKEAIQTHRFRSNNEPKSLEAKILFDADKLDVTGALGIARTMLYSGKMDYPLYDLDKNNKIIITNDNPTNESFVTEYNYKLINIYNHFYTTVGQNMANERKKIMMDYYSSLIEEIDTSQLETKLNKIIK